MSQTKSISGYLLGHSLGVGGFGTVYRVRKEGTPDRAMKILNSGLLGTEQADKRFEREIQTLRSIRHVNTVRIFESGRTSDGNPYFVMELLEGKDLSQHLRDGGRMSFLQALEITGPLCAVLGTAHKQGVVHRDIKASNVFLCSDGRVVLLDFGIAKILEVPGMTLTLTNQIIGTPCAMSPEQLAGMPVTPQTDVYGLGALVFHILTGRVPFASDSLTLTQYLHGHAARVAPSEHSPLSPEIDQVVLQAMSLIAESRQQSCEHFFRDLSETQISGNEQSYTIENAVVVHCSLGNCGDDLDKVLQADKTMEEALVLLVANGFSLVGKAMRAFCCARILSGSLTSGQPLATESKAIIKTTRSLVLNGVPGARFVVRYGKIEVSGNTIKSGDILVPADE